jgi:hypothetical protein
LIFSYLHISPLATKFGWFRNFQLFTFALVIHLILKTMSKKIKPQDNSANQQNANKGTNGTNKQYDHNQGNRGKQLNSNQKSKK